MLPNPQSGFSFIAKAIMCFVLGSSEQSQKEDFSFIMQIANKTLKTKHQLKKILSNTIPLNENL